MSLGREFEKYLNELNEREIEQYVNQGKGTGPLSKMLSHFSLLLLPCVAVQLFKDAQYLPLLVLLALGFTKYENWVMIGLLIYALITQYWMVLIILSVFAILNYLSYYFGKNHVRNLLRENKPIIDPFEGIIDFTIVLPLEWISLALALLFSKTLSIIMWTIFSIALLYWLARCYYRLYPRYNRIHQPMMFRYAKIAAEEYLRAQEGEEFNFSRAAKSLLKTVEFPYASSTDKAEEIFRQAETKMKTFSDHQAFKDILAKVKSQSRLSIDISEFLHKLRNYITTKEAQKYIINYCIAEIIEIIFGPEERIHYLLSVFIGKAK